MKGNEYEYSGSKDLGEVGWSYENSEGKTHEVGTKKANELGIYDMSGNVCEWCFDKPCVDHWWLYLNTYRLCRGGSSIFYASLARVSARSGTGPSNSYSNIGFRVVWSSVP